MKRKEIILFLFAVLALLVGCASGSIIITGEKREPVDPNTVKLYAEPPLNYEVIGIVSASSDFGFTEQNSVDYAILELKKRAAGIGANGIIIENIGENKSISTHSSSNGSFYIESKEKTISGKAIYVIE